MYFFQLDYARPHVSSGERSPGLLYMSRCPTIDGDIHASQEHPEVEWFMWIDSDTMVINPTFELPFHKYKGRDLVIWGNETALLAGDGLKGAFILHC
jgi:hypothetical protein